jgi:hypothetical protein
LAGSVRITRGILAFGPPRVVGVADELAPRRVALERTRKPWFVIRREDARAVDRYRRVTFSNESGTDRTGT